MFLFFCKKIPMLISTCNLSRWLISHPILIGLLTRYSIYTFSRSNGVSGILILLAFELQFGCKHASEKQAHTHIFDIESPLLFAPNESKMQNCSSISNRRSAWKSDFSNNKTILLKQPLNRRIPPSIGSSRPIESNSSTLIELI